MVLKAYWPLDEESGDTAYDVRGSNNGSIGNNPVLGAEGVLGTSSYDFSGNSGKVDVGKGLVSASDNFTVCFWIYPTDNSVSDQRIFDMRGDVKFIPNINRSGGGQLGVWINGNENQMQALPEGQWSQIVCTYDSTNNNVSVYRNASMLAALDADIGSGSEDALMWSGNANYDGGAGDTPIEGRLSQCRLYNHALTQQEIQYLYQVGSRGLHTSDRRTL